jgi:hypothetical protein
VPEFIRGLGDLADTKVVYEMLLLFFKVGFRSVHDCMRMFHVILIVGPNGKVWDQAAQRFGTCHDRCLADIYVY